MGTELYEAALDLRFRLFFKELGLSRSVVADELESSSVHLAIVDKEKLIGYARLSNLKDNDYRISQVVVEPSYQGQGHSTKLLQYLMNRAKTLGAKSIILHSQLPVVSLYEKLGFEAIGNV